MHRSRVYAVLIDVPTGLVTAVQGFHLDFETDDVAVESPPDVFDAEARTWP